MDEIYSQLLKGGKSQAKRHYELSGTLAQSTASTDTKYSQNQALLTLPEAAGPEKPRPVAVAGAAAEATSAAAQGVAASASAGAGHAAAAGSIKSEGAAAGATAAPSKP